MPKQILSIEGMTCHNCVRHTTEALKDLEGVKVVKVSLEDKQAEIETDHPISEEQLRHAVEEEAGYTLVSIR